MGEMTIDDLGLAVAEGGDDLDALAAEMDAVVAADQDVVDGAGEAAEDA